MFFKIKQKTMCKYASGGFQQIYYTVLGSFLRVCLGPLNSNIHPWSQS